MKQKMKKVTKLFLALAIAFCTLTLNVVTNNVYAAEKEYEIYPKPHSITYQDGNYVMRSGVNIVYDSTIDIPTKNHMNEILKSKNKTITTSNQTQEGKTNIYVGTWDSNGPASQYIKTNYSQIDKSIFDKFGGHYVFSKNGEIAVIGKDTDAVFYGITSLKHIFNQVDGSTLRNFTIKDYADTNIRGFIEGYYGIPWTNEDRMSLMKFGGDFKMTGYVFAPKDDAYHTSKWRELYPAAELARIKEMVQVGEATKCRFIWTAHPFMGGFNANKVDEEIVSLLKKFDQLYSVGVRQFGVLGDDVGSLNREVVIKVMQHVTDWGEKKGDVLDPVFCPGGYNDSWQGDYSELNDYDAGFPKNVQIFWTGEAVCQPVEQKTLTKFKTKNLPAGREPRRSPLFWLNWPVNDINGSRLMMGKGSLLQTDININDLSGVVSNPMQEAEASKPALFAVADYSWNVKGFDDDQSWADSFKYVDEDAGDYLHTLAKHMSNPQPNGHGLVLAESEELQPLINEFKTLLSNGNSIIAKGNQLIKELEIIIEACDGFNATTKNTNMKEELAPFVGSLKDLCIAIKGYVQSAIAIENNDDSTAFEAYTQATSVYKSSKKHERQLISGTTTVSPGSTHLIPLADAIQKKLSDKISQIASGNNGGVKFTASSSFSSFYSGKIEDIVDKSLNTSAWHNGFEAVGQYFQVNLSAPTTIYGVNISNGTNDKRSDTFGFAKVKYSTDNGATWKEMNSQEYGEYAEEVKISGVSIDKVTNVRYECTRVGSGNKWPAMREFEVLTEPTQSGPAFTSSVIRTTDKWGIYSGVETSLFDNNDDTGVHYRVRQGDPDYPDGSLAGDYIGVKLSVPIVLGRIHFAQAPSSTSDDYFLNEDLEYSMDGVNWTKIQSFTNTRNIDIDLSDQDITAQYVRVINTQNVKKWIGMREMKVESKVFFNSKAYTNVDGYKSIETNCLVDTATMRPTDNVTLEPNQYIGLKLQRIHQLKEIITDIEGGENLTIKISQNGIEWETVTAGANAKNARYIILENNTSSNLTFNINDFTVKTNEFAGKSLYKASGFSLTNPLNVFDGDRTTQTIYGGSQNKGSYFIYDLGQTIDLKSFKAVCRDSEGDFPRHGKFSASINGTDWTDFLTIGNQDSENPNESTTTDDINFVLPSHEISYNAKEARDINLQVRYIKFEITRTKTGNDKWVRFQEFEINDGEYLPTENNPTFSSTSKETNQGLFNYMTDGDLSTMFIPEDKTGTLSYVVSDQNDVLNTIKIIQNSSKISNAIVRARVLSTTTRAGIQWVELGTLSQTINEFMIPDKSQLLEIEVEWQDTELNLTELSVYSSAVTVVDKTVLNNLITNKEVTTTWITDSIKAYNSAIATGVLVRDSSGSTQASIDSAIKSIQNAITNKVVKGNPTQLQAAIDNAKTESAKYTVSTWKTYSKAINAGTTALAQLDNLSQEKIDTITQDITNATNQLMFNPSNREEGVITIMDIDDFKDSINNPEKVYTKNSYAALMSAYDELKALIVLDKTTPQDPDLFDKAVTKVIELKGKLIALGLLPTLIEEFDNTNKDLYTTDTFEQYQNAVQDSKTLLTNGTESDINNAIKAINNTKKALILKVTVQALKDYVQELEALDKNNYTEQSYQNVIDTIASIKPNIDSATNSQLTQYATELQTVKNNLVSIKVLKSTVERAKTFDMNKYTVSTYNALSTQIIRAEALYKSATADEVATRINGLDKAIRSLKIRVNVEEYQAYIKKLAKEDSQKYTADLYQAYEKAYNALLGLSANLADVSAEQFIQMKDNYEKALKDLKEKSVSETGKTETGDATIIMPLLVSSLLALTVITILRKKKSEEL